MKVNDEEKDEENHYKKFKFSLQILDAKAMLKLYRTNKKKQLEVKT